MSGKLFYRLYQYPFFRLRIFFGKMNGNASRCSAAFQVSEHNLCQRVSLIDSGLTRHFGLALPKGSPHKDALTSIVLQLSENGALGQLREKWFASKCPPTPKRPSPTLHVSSFSKFHIQSPEISYFHLPLKNLNF